MSSFNTLTLDRSSAFCHGIFAALVQSDEQLWVGNPKDGVNHRFFVVGQREVCAKKSEVGSFGGFWLRLLPSTERATASDLTATFENFKSQL